MSERILVAVFGHENDLLGAVNAVRAQGYRIANAYTPYAVHGLDRAMGLKPSRLTWVCFTMGMIGALGMLAFQSWTASFDWALDVGGKPWNSLPSDVPVAFEAAVLLAGLGSVFALFVVSRMYPGKKTEVVHPRVTDDRFVLAIDQADAAFDIDEVSHLLEEFHVLETEERLTSEGGVSCR